MLLRFTPRRCALTACVVLLSLLWPLCAWAQNISARITQSEISTQERVIYHVEVEGNVQGVQPDFSSDFQVVAQSTNTSINFINGQTTRKLTASYTLAPQKAGTLQTGGARITLKNGSHQQSESFAVEVRDAGPPQARPTQPPDPPRQTAPRNPWLPTPPTLQSPAAKAFGEYPSLPLPGSDDLFRPSQWLPPQGQPFVLPFTNKEEVTIGEPFLVEYLYFEPLNALGFEAHDMDEPEFAHAWFEDITDARMSTQNRIMRLRHQDQMYNVQIIRSYMVVPLQEGDFEIPRFGLTVGGYTAHGRMEPIDLSAPEHRVTVQAPPPHDNAPARKTSVGRFHLDATLQPEEARVGDTFHLDLQVEGLGVPAHIHLPDISLPNGLHKLSAPEKRSSTIGPLGWLEGSKSTRLSFQATREGDFEIPPVSFYWYDPWKEKWRHAETDAFTLRVHGHAPEKDPPKHEKNADDLNVSPSWLKKLPTGEHTPTSQGFIAQMRQYGEPWRGNSLYFLFFSLPIIGFFGFIALERLLRRRQKTHAKRRKSSAKRRAVRALKKCAPNDLRSYRAMDQILRTYLQDQGIPGTRGATYEELHNALRATCSTAQADALISHLQALEEARYSGANPVRFHALRNHLLTWLENDRPNAAQTAPHLS